MSDKIETVQIGSFVATTEAGERWTVTILQDVVVVQTRGGTTRRPGLKSLVTADGIHLEQKSQGRYETSFGLKLTSDDVNAP